MELQSGSLKVGCRLRIHHHDQTVLVFEDFVLFGGAVESQLVLESAASSSDDLDSETLEVTLRLLLLLRLKQLQGLSLRSLRQLNDFYSSSPPGTFRRFSEGLLCC